MVVLTGLSGTGKSAALAELAAAGEQVLDLQALACHRGSAFGAFGMPEQPTHKAFQATVRDVLAARDPARVLWVEHCPRYLGSVGLPEELLEAIAAAPTFRLSRPRPERIAAIVAEYGGAGLDQWRAALRRISSRLGPARTTAVQAALDAADLLAAVDVLLTYYDPNYLALERDQAALRPP
jgi:tRNA 2-selenouridine synthase